MRGVAIGGGRRGTDRRSCFLIGLVVGVAGCADAAGATAGGIEAESQAGSTCWVVELKYRARHSRRNVGGSDEDGIWSEMDRLSVLLSISKLGRRFRTPNPIVNLQVVASLKLLTRYRASPKMS